MENFWMYQVEKLEEEQARKKEQAGQQDEKQTEQQDGDEVWTGWWIQAGFWEFFLYIYWYSYVCIWWIHTKPSVVVYIDILFTVN